mmetsp:Transcript_15519/g.49800  ORF Transcript_15519/g.49800 Transcript_15519/m.49800 type:complete len:220 (+) Transcript_15519:122-781(+)
MRHLRRGFAATPAPPRRGRGGRASLRSSRAEASSAVTLKTVRLRGREAKTGSSLTPSPSRRTYPPKRPYPTRIAPPRRGWSPKYAGSESSRSAVSRSTASASSSAGRVVRLRGTLSRKSGASRRRGTSSAFRPEDGIPRASSSDRSCATLSLATSGNAVFSAAAAALPPSCTYGPKGPRRSDTSRPVSASRPSSRLASISSPPASPAPLPNGRVYEQAG